MGRGGCRHDNGEPGRLGFVCFETDFGGKSQEKEGNDRAGLIKDGPGNEKRGIDQERRGTVRNVLLKY